jgi:hypothetical protein
LWRKLVTELPFEAVDPLYHFAHSRKGIPGQLDPVGRLNADFRDQIRELLEFGLKNRDRLSSMDKHSVSPYYKAERTEFIVHSLGHFGDSRTLMLLEPLVDTNDLGPTALKAKVFPLRPVRQGRAAARVTVDLATCSENRGIAAPAGAQAAR